MSLNMKKEIRAELRILRKAFNKVIADKVAHYKALTRLDQAAIRVCKKTRKSIRREFVNTQRVTDKSLSKISRRIAILNGRLA